MAGTTHLLQSKISPEKMDTATLPLSPTGSCSDEQLPQGFEDLVHHNNATSYPREPVGMEQINVRSPSQSDSKHSTLAPPRTTMSPHVNNQYGLSQHQEPSVYTDNNYAYQAQPMYDGHDGTYPSLPEEHQPAYTTPESSPSQRSDMISLRNASAPKTPAVPRTIASKARVQKPKKRKGRAKADKDKVHLEKPLSEMGEEWKQSMAEIETYINRPAEVRRKEIDLDRKQPGKIKRPMNSFMLYRKAFQNHTKAYCEHNNHQVVSQVCGASWDQEPEHIKKQFADWAKLERTNHQKAHPGYKFTPAKPKTAPKRKRDSDDEASDLDPYEWENAQRLKMARSNTGTPVPEHEAIYSSHQGYYAPPQQYAQQPGVHPGMVPGRAVMSSYSFNNPNKSMPAPYGQITMPQTGQYLSANSMANHSYQQRGFVEDVSYHKTPSPSNPYHQPMQPSLMDAYASPPQPRGLEHTTPPAQFVQNNQLDTGMFPVNGASFDPSDPLHIPDHGIESSGLNFNFNEANVPHPMGDVLMSEFGESMLQDQQAQQLLRGNNESWDIQPLDEAQAGDQYDDWGVDPSLSQPYAHDPPLSEVYNARD